MLNSKFITARNTLIALFVAMAALFVLPTATQAAYGIPAGGVDLEGFAWSAYLHGVPPSRTGIGWISMSCENTGTCATSDYGVRVNFDGTLSGYAWASNGLDSNGNRTGVGWINFNPPGPYPSGNTVINDSARVRAVSPNYPNLEISGWARVCSAAEFPATCSGGAGTNSGGWDGWIALGGVVPSTGNPYGITMSAPGATVGSYAWGGSTVAGWINFGPVGPSPGVTWDLDEPVVTVTGPGGPVTGPGTPLIYDPTLGGPPDTCTLTDDAGSAPISIPIVAGTVIVNPTADTTYTIICSNAGGPSVPQSVTVEVRPDLQIAGVNVNHGAIDLSTGLYSAVTVQFAVNNVPAGTTNIPFSIDFAGNSHSGTFDAVDAGSVSHTFTNIPYTASAAYTIEVDNSPNTGVVPEDVLPLNPGASVADNEDWNEQSGTYTGLVAPDPTIVINVLDIVPPGTEVPVTVTISDTPYVTNCTLFGPGLNEPFTTGGAIPTVAETFFTSPVVSTDPLQNAATIAVRCDLPTGGDYTEAVTINVTPTVQET